MTKTRLNGADNTAKLTAQNVLCYVLVTLLKLLHPFMPFITEEIYQALPKCGGAEDILMMSQWPEYSEALNFPAEENAMEAVMDLIRAIRARRAEMNVCLLYTSAVEALPLLRRKYPELCPQLLPIHTAAGSGLLLSVKSDWASIDEQCYPGIRIALVKTELGSGYTALWGGERSQDYVELVSYTHLMRNV